ncbi:MAG: amino acid ABC transporter substrate-binding protein [Oscillospiraceae bacterium]|nr:amino acid ABC transporter substrate-binding protein [Oscillospiraceae bacterium]MBQ8731989.1 amino acid ABC transporter substrate-binding protein [Oscillospiraceae bacterium]
MAEISKKWFGADIVLKDADYVEEHEASADDESLQKIKDKGYFIVGLDDSFPPMGYRDENNEIVGFDIDLAKEVAKRMGVEVRFQPIDWNSKELELDGGKIDMIWNGMTITDERVAAMYFAKPYLANTQVVIVPVDSPIQTKADLAGKKISIQEGSSAVDAVTADDIYEQIGELVYFGNNQEAYSDLKIGRVDAFVVDRVAGSYILKTDGTLAE